MADDLPMPSSRLPASEVAQRSFSTTRRGFDPEEVQAFLELVSGELRSAERREQELLHELAAAEERARHPALDEAMLSTALGQKSAAVLRHAHEEAARVTQQAEEAAAETSRDAQQHATEAEVQAESAAAERIAEAELAANAMRQEARDESSAMLQAARNECDALIDRARADGRTIIEQAEGERRQVLADMASRRRAMTSQIEQFRSARDEIASSVAGVRDSVDRVMDDMRRADAAAMATAAAAARVGEGGDPADVPSGAAHADAGAAHADARAGDVDAGDGQVPEDGEELPRADGGHAGEPESTVEGGPTASYGDPETVAEGVIEDLVEDLVEVVVDDVGEAGIDDDAGSGAGPTTRRARPQRRVALRFDDIATVVEAPQGTPLPAKAADVGTDDPVDVEGLFARLRSRREDPVNEAPPRAPAEDPPVVQAQGVRVVQPQDARVVRVAEAGPTTEDAGHEDVDADGPDVAATEAGAAVDGAPEADPSPEEVAIARRASAIDPLVTTMARRLKRAFQDDQNRLLDRLRKGTGEWSDDLLPDEAAQRAQYVKAAAGQVRESMAAGISFARSSTGGRQGRAPVPDQQAVDAISDELSTTVVTLLRRRLEGADGHDVAERIGAAYREWRGERIERLAEDRVIEAFGTGVLSAAGRAGGVRWIRGDVDGGCADCEDNELAGRVEIGEKFPTGHRHPPAHAGCRCLILPTPS